MKLKKREKELIKNAVENRISEIEKAIDEDKNTLSKLLEYSYLDDCYQNEKRKSIQENQDLREEYKLILNKLKKVMDMELRLYSGIEFRAFLKANKLMYDVLSIDIIENKALIENKLYNLRVEAKYPEDCILMQFTGMQDKTGQKIFEGDILEIDENITEDNKKHIFVVSKIKGAFCISSDKVQGISSVFDKATNDNVMTLFELFENYNEDLSVDELDYAEVVGNIYENSDKELF